MPLDDGADEMLGKIEKGSLAMRQFARLSTQEFDELTRFLREEQTIIDQKLRKTKEHEALLRFQGRAEFLEDLLDLIRRAPDMT